MNNKNINLPAPILITGAHGMLGSDLVESLLQHLPSDKLLCTDYDTLDITDASAVDNYFNENKPSLVINAAAYTDVDKAEVEKEKAYLINVQGPKNLTAACMANGLPMIHFSTEYVFSGQGNHPWTETDIPAPPVPNYYAHTKLWAENEVLKNELALVLRVQWLYGKKKDRFTPLKDKKVFTPFSDQFGAPTWTKQVCEVVIELIQKEAKGLYHFAYDDNASWADVYDFVKQELDLDLELIPKKSADVSLPAKRPLNGVMSNKKLLHFLGKESMGSWKDPLREFLKSR